MHTYYSRNLKIMLMEHIELEPKIGEIFEYKGKKYKCQRTKDGTAAACEQGCPIYKVCGKEGSDLIKCMPKERKDNKLVKIVPVDKDGNPIRPTKTKKSKKTKTTKAKSKTAKSKKVGKKTSLK